MRLGPSDWPPIARDQELGTLLLRFGVHGAEINPVVLIVSRATIVDEMPPVGQEGRIGMQHFLARGISRRDLNQVPD